VSSAAQAIVNIDGLSDFTSEAARKYEDDPAKQPSSAGAWFGGRYAEKEALWREASPTFYVNAKTPPILFIGSGQARFSVGREEMIAKMDAAGRGEPGAGAAGDAAQFLVVRSVAGADGGGDGAVFG
jgi:hypothetical protein